MKTLKGVIAASTFAEYETPLDDSNLFIHPLYFTLSSGIYAIEFEDSLGVSALAPSGVWQEWPVDSMTLSMKAPSVYRRDAVKYWSYDRTPPESMSVSFLAPSVSRKTAVRYLTYNGEPESLTVTMLPPTVFRQKVVDRFEYTIPEESLAIAMLAPTVTRTNT